MFLEVLVCLMSVFLLTAAAMGVECYGKNNLSSSNDTRKNNRNFLSVMIAVGVIGIIGAVYMLIQEARKQGAQNTIKAFAGNKTPALNRN
mgnify:FL=1